MGGAFRRLSVVVEKLLHHDFIGDSARLQNIEGFPLKKAVSLRAHRGTAFVTVAYRSKKLRDHACFSAGGVDSYIITVRSPEEAVKKARELADEGFGALEVCGAFGENLAREMYQAADRRLTVSYVVCPKDQEEASLQFWGPGKA